MAEGGNIMLKQANSKTKRTAGKKRFFFAVATFARFIPPFYRFSGKFYNK